MKGILYGYIWFLWFEILSKIFIEWQVHVGVVIISTSRVMITDRG
jgi:hypothetical protein